jgi:DNA polymerase-3 subunit alpha
MHGVEELGLLKMDFLGLRNLDVITDTVKMIQRRHDPDFEVDRLSLEDAKTYELLGRGDTIGVFQLESTPMRALIRAMAPNSFDDVSALIALYRPGPMGVNMHYDYADRKNRRKPVEYFHPDAEAVLGDTYGLMIYQESVMRVSQKFAGYSMAEADNLRKACGKKIRELMEKERGKFEEGCETTGYGRALGKELFDVIEKFADYAFNKSHSYGYGLITYQTAYLKANYPVEYLSCLLTSVKSNLDKAGIYLADARASDIRVLVPDVNRSEMDFAPDRVEQSAILFGLSAVRNVGEGLVQQLLDERAVNGPYESFYDFVERVPEQVLNKRLVESLIKGGGFDSLGHPRQGLLAVFEQIIDTTVAKRRERDQGVMSLFDDLGDGAPPLMDQRIAIPDVEFDKSLRLKFEKEMLGLYVSDHPLFGVEGVLRRRSDCSIGDLAEREDGGFVNVGGLITGLSRKYTKKGDPMAVFVLEDLQDSVEVTVFPRMMLEHGHKLADDAVVIIRARLDRRDDTPKLMAQEVSVVDVAELAANPPLRLHIPASALNELRLDRLKAILSEFPGESPVFLDLGEGRVLRLNDQFNVNRDKAIGEIRVAFGHDAIAS